MATTQELQDLLQRLTDMREELRAVTSDAKAAHHALRDELRKHRDEVAAAITAEVTAQMGAITKEVRDGMIDLVADEVEAILAELRLKWQLAP